jgi:hypothetical protein
VFWVRQGRLLGAGLVEALMIDADIQTARKEHGARLQLFGIGNGNLTDCLEVFFQTSAVETGLDQILCGPYECSGLSTDCSPQRAERPAGFWGHENESLFRLFRHGHEDAFIMG